MTDIFKQKHPISYILAAEYVYIILTFFDKNKNICRYIQPGCEFWSEARSLEIIATGIITITLNHYINIHY